jgi:hypothetical protein
MHRTTIRAHSVNSLGHKLGDDAFMGIANKLNAKLDAPEEEWDRLVAELVPKDWL